MVRSFFFLLLATNLVVAEEYVPSFQSGLIASGGLSARSLFARQAGGTCTATYPLDCAPLDACCRAGQTCCSTSCCSAGQICQTAVLGGIGCCPPGASACDALTCCPAGTRCIGGGQCRVSGGTGITATSNPGTIVASASTSFSTATSNGAITQTLISLSTSLSTSTSTSYSTSTSTGSLVFATFGPICPTGTLIGSDPLSQACNGLPVMYFPLVKDFTDDVISSMCDIMGADQVQLTWNGNDPAAAIQKRVDAGCYTGRCEGVTSQFAHLFGGPLKCFQFPFASTKEGGKGSKTACVNGIENLIVARIIAAYVRLYSLSAGSPFIVKVLPGCSSSSFKRDSLSLPAINLDELDSVITTLAEEALVRRATTPSSYSNSSTQFVADTRPGASTGAGIQIAPLNSVAGAISITFDVPSLGTAKSLSIVDWNGYEYYNSNSPPTGSKVTFTTPGRLNETLDLAIVAEYAASASATSWSYSASATAANPTSTGTIVSGGPPASGSGTASGGGGANAAVRNDQGYWIAVAATGVFGMMICL